MREKRAKWSEKGVTGLNPERQVGPEEEGGGENRPERAWDAYGAASREVAAIVDRLLQRCGAVGAGLDRVPSNTASKRVRVGE